MSQPVLSEPFVLYQSSALSGYSNRLIHGFTGKPITLGGPNHTPEVVQHGRQQLCQQFHLHAEAMNIPKQVHGTQARLNQSKTPEEADAVIVTKLGIPALVQVADCVPLILYAPEQHVGAVIHAGWRGTAQAISQAIAQTLIHDYHADPKQMIAAIGPAIKSCCYEVSPEVAEQVGATIRGIPDATWQTPSPNQKPMIDLQQVNALQLQALGLAEIDILPHCTRCETKHLWSHRRGETGRQAAFLQLL